MQITVPHAFSRDLTPGNGGEPHRILVYVPDGAPPPGGWPSLWLTDGNAGFTLAVEAMRIQATHTVGTDVAEGVVVGLGYPTDKPYDPFRRSWDLSPPPGRTYPPFSTGGGPVRTGGALDFLRTLETEILPWVGRQAALAPGRRALFGHSFGGLFALLALFERPGLFPLTAAASPALSWEDFALERFEAAFMAALAAGTAPPTPLRVLLSAGEHEGDTPAPFYAGRADEAERSAHQARIGTIRHARDLAARLNAANHAGLGATYETFAGETHMSVLPAAINRAVQAAFRPSAPKNRDALK